MQQSELTDYQCSGAEYPWRDEQTMRRLYLEEGLTMSDIADVLGTSPSTVCTWIGKHDIPVCRRHRDSPEELDDPEQLRKMHVENNMSAREIGRELGCGHKTVMRRLREFDIELLESPAAEYPGLEDEDRLTELHLECGMTAPQIAEKFGCNRGTVLKKLRKYGVPIRRAMRNRPTDPAHFSSNGMGYERWHSSIEGELSALYHHQLLAVAAGEDPHDVFSDEMAVHHKNHIAWDNRVENLQLMSRSDHAEYHSNIAQGNIDPLWRTDPFNPPEYDGL